MKDIQNTLVELQIEGGIATITLNSPQTLNALSEDMLTGLQNALDGIAVNRDVKAVILRGAGNHFCAGHNLKEMTARRADADKGSAYFNALFGTCSKMMMSIVDLPQPVIAEVKGIATAAGCQLVATCDLAIAAEDARFATSGVNIGLFCSTPMVALSRNVPRKKAMEMLLLGEFLPASKAEEMGLINRVVPAADLETASAAMAQIIVDKSPVAIKTGKKAFYEQCNMPLDAAYAYAGAVMAENMLARDATEGINAFIDKKPMPDWTGE
ncbi:enoyl-CoA hydratase [Roseobacter denitrificans]|uniref:Enoyl-CoA hydratase domain-containing protein 3, mitochondrial n=1 Tax=Roseobacter denitrificans (strain ATCC 33942 / OCh 114) TaxID=375451 RepID=Q16CV7_ROSDO|nr:enoyl-CoA hydratase [Roseobacter denitrificans]ABG30186.1 enoyl-CoA hydratase/isomerase family protein [Roseobacter denitrificans OCh 114]AVL53374.1 enoyl-CoA hydratase [Roseobacter denitrificans]SFF70411.1 Enoyl-CoA hydratase/carnithine racemase [Roseobacter denitrificans OCh 114]